MTDVLGRPLRILVAEDDALIAFDLVDALEKFGCAAAGPVATVKAALEQADDPVHAIDGALLDLDLRGQRSYPIAAALIRRNIPFAFTSGYGIEAIEADFRAYPCLLKPVNRSDLLAVLRGFLSPAPVPAGAPQEPAGPDALG
ncbi:MAG: response regulator [Rhodospirillales bacterium]|nr:response regulator [Rhodospirillales bacterium]